VVTDILLKGLN